MFSASGGPVDIAVRHRSDEGECVLTGHGHRLCLRHRVPAHPVWLAPKHFNTGHVILHCCYFDLEPRNVICLFLNQQWIFLPAFLQRFPEKITSPE